MRDKFSELIAQGCAPGNRIVPHGKDRPDPEDMLSIIYNRMWGIITDTHMTALENGNHIITGTFVADKTKWTNLLYSSSWGGVKIDVNGFHSLSEMLSAFGLSPKVTAVNGQIAIELEPCTECECPDGCCECPTKAYTTESGFSQPIGYYMDARRFEDCFEGPSKDLCKRLNESKWVPGNRWHIFEGRLVGPLNGRTLLMDLKFLPNKTE